ncbi:HD-GYP domain-containing protein [Litoribrevibacter albus]|uniref:Transcriptional regulator n=1 Tax=Litoribrevibacter albus TaxID=1473156 RepID=A0AA37SCQ6_9GAMM|nr:HD domain-containing phosphohydrolase [Litoribrevibacter albus]GLQ31997.1 transcriptional regulator [Litoribrevibacter albus]
MTTPHTNPIQDGQPLAEKLCWVRKLINQHHAYIDRIAVALYDTHTDLLKTFIYSSDEETPLEQYQYPLSKSQSLSEIAQTHVPRIIPDLSQLEQVQKEHIQALLKAGFRSSYTYPMVYDDHFLGFIFFNSKRPLQFDEFLVTELDMVGQMIALMVFSELSSIQTLVATIRTVLDMTHSRDPETGGHLERMSRYAREIARALAEKYDLNDRYIEQLFQFAPLHDVGKIKVPDRVLLKKGPLNKEEQEVMRHHPEDGKYLIDKLIHNHGFERFENIDMLRNIALYHHEAVDGSGYPCGLKGTEIPLEARIVAVADVFDALTSSRPYKQAWTNERALALLEEFSGTKFDRDCVDAFKSHMPEIELIQATFSENKYG